MTEELEPDEIYIQLGENRTGLGICLRRWQETPFEGGTKYVRDQEWKNLYLEYPQFEKPFVCRKKFLKNNQFEAILKLESDSDGTLNCGNPYPVLMDLYYPDENILDDDWYNYEWKEITNG